MKDKPDDVPSLSEIGDGEDLPGYWAESTTITVDRWVKQSLDEHRDGRPWNQFLEKLRREHADPITLNDADDLADVLVDELGAKAGGPQVDDSEIAATVVRQFDYAELAKCVADELEGRMR